jgi:acetyltransferase
MTDPSSVAERVKAHARLERKPILACWMGGTSVEPGRAILSASGIPTFAYPDTAVRAFDYMRRYAHNLRGLYETPALAGDQVARSSLQSKAQAAIERARKSGRTLLTEAESKQILELYGIPTVQTRIARSEAEAVKRLDPENATAREYLEKRIPEARAAEAGTPAGGKPR